MGKDSLIKSTAKKSDPEKEKEKPKKKTTKKAAAKSAAPKKAAAKSTAKKQTKATKSTKAAKAAKAAKPAKKTQSASKAPQADKKPTLKELLFKTFDGQMPPAVDKTPKPDFSGMTAPPFIATDDPAEAKRLKGLLTQKFDMAEIKAAAKPPEARKVEKVEPEQPVTAEPETVIEKEAPPDAAQAPETEPAGAEKAPKTEDEPESPKPAAQPVAETTVRPEPSSSPEPQVDMDAETEKEPADPVLRAAKIGILIAAAVVLMIIWASITNSAKYYITAQGAAVKIEKGNFSPTGKSLFVVLHGYQLADPVKETYSRKEVFPIIFGYYLDKADTMLEVAGLPDYNAITADLEKAERYALTDEMSEAVQKRTNYIQRMTLLYKAEVDASKTDIESLESAIKSLEQVKPLVNDPAQLEAIDQKIASVTAAIEAAKIEQAEKAAAEDAEETAPKEAPQE